jgi:citrate lyase subunit beta/citryl-CoA lyase
LILDLEDGVAPDQKETARRQVVEAVRAGGYGQRELVIRVNGLNTPWGYADLVAAAGSGADAVLLPKVESSESVRLAQSVIEANGAPDTLAIWCMIETPRGVMHAAEIAEAARVSCLVMGTSDLANDLRARHTRERLPLLTSLGLCVLAARAAGIAILDGVYLDLSDDEGFEFACRQGVELGFDGKTLIHPKTIEPANRIFAPTEKELDFSRRVIEAHATAAQEGKGVVVVDGKLIENLHVANARRLVGMAEMIRDMETTRTA